MTEITSRSTQATCQQAVSSDSTLPRFAPPHFVLQHSPNEDDAYLAESVTAVRALANGMACKGSGMREEGAAGG
jgi:hypothetical protein